MGEGRDRGGRRVTTSVAALALATVGMSTACGRACPSFADPAEALRAATENPPEDCVERWSAHVCAWSPSDHERRRAALAEAHGKGTTAQIDELYCGCIASATDPCFVTISKRGSSQVTFITTGAPGCENAALPVSAQEAVQVPGGCGFALTVQLAASE